MQEDKKILLRVEQLLSLAAGEATPVEEARTAAMAAVRLIAKHKFKVVSENVERPRTFNPSDPFMDLDDLMEVLFRQKSRQHSPHHQTKYRDPTVPREYVRGRAGPFVHCRGCTGMVEQGEEVLWIPQEGVWHRNCVEPGARVVDKVGGPGRV